MSVNLSGGVWQSALNNNAPDQSGKYWVRLNIEIGIDRIGYSLLEWDEKTGWHGLGQGAEVTHFAPFYPPVIENMTTPKVSGW
jgi:hypothetical protein